jgi:hypothetical protein
METGSDDPFLTECTEDEESTLMALMMMRRHEAGKRGKAATSFTAVWPKSLWNLGRKERKKERKKSEG